MCGVSDMDVDITIEEGIDVPSIQAEQFQVLIQLAGTQPGLIPPEILIAASSLRNKDQLLEMLKEHQQAQAQQQQKVAQMAEQKAGEISRRQAQARPTRVGWAAARCITSREAGMFRMSA